MDINDDNIRFLNTSYRASYQRAFQGVRPLWPRFTTEVPSATKKNLFAWLGQFPVVPRMDRRSSNPLGQSQWL